MDAAYDPANGAHAGFIAGICSPEGNAQDECPGWPAPAKDMIVGCLQQMWDEGPGADFKAHGHYINMSSTKYTMAACGFYTTDQGKIWAVQDFK